MKVLVCGSRSWDDHAPIFDRLAELPRGTTIIHGGARGADRMAATVAAKLGFGIEEFVPHWRNGTHYNPKAGLERNIAMLELRPDLVIAFWKDGSTGTGHTLAEARKREIPVEIIQP